MSVWIRPALERFEVFHARRVADPKSRLARRELPGVACPDRGMERRLVVFWSPTLGQELACRHPALLLVRVGRGGYTSVWQNSPWRYRE